MQANRTSRSPKAHIALWTRCSRVSPIARTQSVPLEAGVVHHRRWASSPIARTDRVPLKPASFTTEGGRLHSPVVHMLWASSPIARTERVPFKPASFTTEGGRLHQSHAQIAFRSSRRRSPQKVGVFTNRRHMLWASSPVRRPHAGRPFTSVVHHRRWASSPIARTDRVPLKPASFTTEGGRLHQSSSHAWASSPVVVTCRASFTSRRPHAMGVFTSSSSTCYGRRHQFINIFLTRGRVLSEFYLPCERTRPSGSKSA